MQHSPDPHAAGASRALVDCCEELFQYVMRVNRACKLDPASHPQPDTVRADLQRLLADAQGCASKDPVMARAMEHTRLALYFFVDSMLLSGTWSHAGRWKPLQYDLNERGGDDKFWELFDAALARSGEDADQAVEVFYTMVGLGFTGSYEGMHDLLRDRMNQAWARVQKRMGSVERRLSPEAYAYTREETLNLNPAGSLLRCGLILLIGLATLIGATWAVVNQARDEVRQITNTLADRTPAQEGGN